MEIPANDNRRYIHISPSSLDDLEFCRRFYNWREWMLPSKSIRLDEGSVFHKILEFYYKGKGILLPTSECEEIAVESAREHYLSGGEDVDVEILERMLEIFHEYVAEYGDSDWEIYMHDGKPAVEIPSSAILYENDKLVILFEIITDLIIVKNGKPVPVDHKTRDKNVKPVSLTNQFMGTLWLLQADEMYFNAIGVQKNIPETGRFHRYPIGFAQSVIEEWRHSVIFWVLRLLQAEETGYWDPNHKACWGCVFKDICSYPEETREALIATQFVKRKPRDMYGKPVKVVE